MFLRSTLFMVALCNRADHYIFMLWFVVLVTVARDRDSDSERLLYFGRVIYYFSVHQIFDIPGPIFAKICHTTRYVLK